jgi:transposase
MSAIQIPLVECPIWVATQPIDFRSSIDGLCALVVNLLKAEPTRGLYIFYNRPRDKIKALLWHKNGFMLIYKRLEQGHFAFQFSENKTVMTLTPREFNWLLAGLDWQRMSHWKELDFGTFS